MPSPYASARRYAEAVFGLAQDAGTIDAWHADLRLAADVFADPTVAAFFADPKRSAEEKQQNLRRMFEGSVQPHALALLQMLVERGRVDRAPAVFTRFEELLREARGIVVAEVTTAIPVDAVEQQRIADELGRMTGKRVELRMRVDPSIIGGMVARIGDRLIDGSVATSLQQLRERLTA